MMFKLSMPEPKDDHFSSGFKLVAFILIRSRKSSAGLRMST